jgi:F-type H+-transporting ATPase subunit c
MTDIVQTAAEVVSNPGIADAAKYIAVGICAISMMTAALGVAKIWSTIIDTVGRNPTVKKDVSLFGWVGFATVEAIALYALVLALLIMFV